MHDDSEEERDSGDRSLVLLRHGIAEDAGAGQTDEARALTPEGHARMKQIAIGLERAFPRVHTIYASPLLRAQQTAMWVAKAYHLETKIETTEALVPSASPRALTELLRSQTDGRIIVVGHEPNLSTNLLALIRAEEHALVELKKGGAACVRLNGAGMGVLQWMMTGRLLAKLAKD
jgi:phosphohistidine phosphatase